MFIIVMVFGRIFIVTIIVVVADVVVVCLVTNTWGISTLIVVPDGWYFVHIKLFSHKGIQMKDTSGRNTFRLGC